MLNVLSRQLYLVRILYVYLSPLSLSILMAIFPGEPGLAGFIEVKDDGNGGDNWSCKSCKAAVKLSQTLNRCI